MTPSRDIDRLIAIMAVLRTPGSGCPWDLEQNFASIAPYTIEEAYEVADAILRGDLDDLKDELGDLLLQVVFHARMAEEAGAFAFGDVVEAITAKLIRRHPHVFAEAEARGPDAVRTTWEAVKAAEEARTRRRASAGEARERTGLLDGVPTTLPALTRAAKLQARAASVGFDWADLAPVLDKLHEELAEFEAEAARDTPEAERLEDELGDILFAVVNLARHAGVDAEAALRRTNAKFLRRFAHIEAGLARRGQNLEAATLAEMEDLWTEAKERERAP